MKAFNIVSSRSYQLNIVSGISLSSSFSYSAFGVGLGSIIKFKVCGPAGSLVFLRSHLSPSHILEIHVTPPRCSIVLGHIVSLGSRLGDPARRSYNKVVKNIFLT